MSDSLRTRRSRFGPHFLLYGGQQGSPESGAAIARGLLESPNIFQCAQPDPAHNRQARQPRCRPGSVVPRRRGEHDRSCPNGERPHRATYNGRREGGLRDSNCSTAQRSPLVSRARGHSVASLSTVEPWWGVGLRRSGRANSAMLRRSRRCVRRWPTTRRHARFSPAAKGAHFSTRDASSCARPVDCFAIPPGGVGAAPGTGRRRAGVAEGFVSALGRS